MASDVKKGKTAWWLILAVPLVIASIIGCAGVHRARGVTTSGFLSDYSQLHKGTRDEAQLLYIKPKVDLRKYDKIILDPIKIYSAPKDSALRKISNEDLQKLINYFDATIRANLADNFTFVTTPGPGVMRFRIALTEAKSANVPLDLASSVIPIGLAISTIKSVTVGRGVGVGSVGTEFEALDSQTGERLGAFVDARIGHKFTGKFDKFDQWRAVKAAFDYWAARLNIRLIELQNA